MYSTFSKNLASFLQVEQTCFPVCRFSLEVDFFFCALQRPTLLFIGDPLLCSTLLTFLVTFVLTNTSAQPSLADWTGAAVRDRLLRVGTAQGKPRRDGWFAGSYIKGVLVKFGVIIYGLGISVGTHAVLDSA